MYNRVFLQILDSSLADNWQTRHVFEDLLKLADRNGVVDMTQEAIARRTNVPVKIVRSALLDLCKPDPRSRNPKEHGKRLVKLDDHRDWGWQIVNYVEYRDVKDKDELRAKAAERQRLHREQQGVQPTAEPESPPEVPF